MSLQSALNQLRAGVSSGRVCDKNLGGPPSTEAQFTTGSHLKAHSSLSVFTLEEDEPFEFDDDDIFKDILLTPSCTTTTTTAATISMATEPVGLPQGLSQHHLTNSTSSKDNPCIPARLAQQFGARTTVGFSGNILQQTTSLTSGGEQQRDGSMSPISTDRTENVAVKQAAALVAKQTSEFSATSACDVMVARKLKTFAFVKTSESRKRASDVKNVTSLPALKRKLAPFSSNRKEDACLPETKEIQSSMRESRGRSLDRAIEGDTLPFNDSSVTVMPNFQTTPTCTTLSTSISSVIATPEKVPCSETVLQRLISQHSVGLGTPSSGVTTPTRLGSSLHCTSGLATPTLNTATPDRFARKQQDCHLNSQPDASHETRNTFSVPQHSTPSKSGSSTPFDSHLASLSNQSSNSTSNYASFSRQPSKSGYSTPLSNQITSFGSQPSKYGYSKPNSSKTGYSSNQPSTPQMRSHASSKPGYTTPHSSHPMSTPLTNYPSSKPGYTTPHGNCTMSTELGFSTPLTGNHPKPGYTTPNSNCPMFTKPGFSTPLTNHPTSKPGSLTNHTSSESGSHVPRSVQPAKLKPSFSTPLAARPAPIICTPTVEHDSHGVGILRTPVSLPQRKFPGPAGLLPPMTPGQNMDSIYIAPPSTPLPVSTPRLPHLSVTPSVGVASGQDSGDFEHGPWVDMLHDLDLSGTDSYSSALLNYSISNAIKQSSRKELRKGKVTHLRAILKNILTAGRNASAVLKDPTGEIMCTIHSQVLEEYRRELQPGAVLVLRQVSMFSPSPRKHYLNITPPNVVTIYPPTVSAESRQSLTQLPFRYLRELLEKYFSKGCLHIMERKLWKLLIENKQE